MNCLNRNYKENRDQEGYKQLSKEFHSHWISIALKRVLDIIFSLVLLLILSPLLLVLAVAVIADDGCPAFYKQNRCTQDGRVFQIIKLRSMKNGTDEVEGCSLVQEHDLRVTGIGRVLRRSKLDEIPQLINILKGDMSFVGPRPERPELIAEIEKELPEFRLRMVAKAGLTGLAQVKGDYYTPPAEKLKWDLEYINSFSLWTDLKILLMTIPAIING